MFACYLSVHPYSFHGGVAGHDLLQRRLDLLKLLQQLPVALLSFALSFLQLHQVLLKLHHSSAENIHKKMHTPLKKKSTLLHVVCSLTDVVDLRELKIHLQTAQTCRNNDRRNASQFDSSNAKY